MTVKIETIDGPYKSIIEEVRKMLDEGNYFEIPVFDSVERAIFHYKFGVNEDEGFASVDGNLYYIYWDVISVDSELVPLLIS